MGSAVLFIFMVALAYLSGSLCAAILVSRTFDLPDPCIEGSKNPGATNVLRLAGKKYAALVLFVDMLKGFLPVLIGEFLGAGPATLGFTCLAATLGHMYPVFFQFKGGKAVATALGAFLALHFIMGAALIALWILIANFSRYSSLASIITLSVAPFYTIVSLRSIESFPPLLLLSLLVLYKHRGNISRLIEGTEPKINFKTSDLTSELLKEKPNEVADGDDDEIVKPEREKDKE